MGEVWCRRGREYGELFGNTQDGTLVGGGDEEMVDDDVLKIGPQCEELISQAIKLQDLEENLLALRRLTGAVQVCGVCVCMCVCVCVCVCVRACVCILSIVCVGLYAHDDACVKYM